MSGRGTGRWELTSLRMLCARRKGFASKSYVPPPTEHPTSLDPTSRLRNTTLPNVRHPLTRTSPSSGTRIHCVPIRSHLPVPLPDGEGQVKYGFSESWRPISWSLCSISSIVFLPQFRVMRRSSLEWVISSRTVWMSLSWNK